MKVTYAGQTYDCTKAVRQGDNAALHLTDGSTVEFVGVSDTAWDKFQIEGGDWTVVSPTPSDAERLAALESAMLAMMGGTVNV